jgi:hypothetical protein
MQFYTMNLLDYASLFLVAKVMEGDLNQIWLVCDVVLTFSYFDMMLTKLKQTYKCHQQKTKCSFHSNDL